MPQLAATSAWERWETSPLGRSTTQHVQLHPDIIELIRTAFLAGFQAGAHPRADTKPRKTSPVTEPLPILKYIRQHFPPPSTTHEHTTL